MRGFHACTPRIDEPGPTCNQLSAAIRSSNGDRYGIGERLPIVCDRVRRILIGREREREKERSIQRAASIVLWSREGLGLGGGRRWMELDRSRDRSFHRAKVEQSSVLSMVEGSWRAREEEMGIVERESGNQRRRPRFATNNLWLKLFRSPSPPADTPWPTTSAVTRGQRFQSRTADVLVLVLLVFRTGEGGHSRGALSLSLLFFCEYWWTTLVKKSRYDKPSREIITN